MIASTRPRIALTMGDCAGIGPELTLHALNDFAIARACQLVVYGNLLLLQRVSHMSGIPMPDTLDILTQEVAFPNTASHHHHILFDLPLEAAFNLQPGKIQPACATAAFDWLCKAVHDVQTGHADALVTAPLNKAALHSANINFPGHTEILAYLTHTSNPCMAFYAQNLFISLATIHEPLSKVSSLLSINSLIRTIRLTHTACKDFGILHPRLGVLALNPHAGENGLFGIEEQTIIKPALLQATTEGIKAIGPLVPDIAFTWLLSGNNPPFDAYVAMYHDQGLIPFKIAAFDKGVNLTLGLPIIRTSPDHGTAFDIAWKGKASPSSLFSAIHLAIRMLKHEHPHHI